MSRIKDLQKYVHHVVEGNEKKANQIAHLHGVALAAAILAKKRGEDTELATMAGLLHDLHSLTMFPSFLSRKHRPRLAVLLAGAFFYLHRMIIALWFDSTGIIEKDGIRPTNRTFLKKGLKKGLNQKIKKTKKDLRLSCNLLDCLRRAQC